MRDYAKISPRFWVGETGRMLRGEGADVQIVALYLMTCPASNMIGLYHLSLPTLCHETGSPSKGAYKALARLSEAGFAHYDEAQELVWVPEMARYQIGESLEAGDNRIKGIVRELDSYKKSRFYADFIDRYKEPFRLPIDKPLGSPLQGPSKPLRSQEQDQEQEQEQAKEQAAPLALASPLSLGKADNATQRATVDKHAQVAIAVLDALNASRKRVIPRAHAIKPSYTSLDGICGRLDAGKSLEDCLHVVAVGEQEVRKNADSAKWFDHISPFRPENFERKLAAPSPPKPKEPEPQDEWRRQLENRLAAPRSKP